jgi:alpha-beta hydrolase superfamily lysophospholipase
MTKHLVTMAHTILPAIFLYSVSLFSAAAELLRHTVSVEGHPMALWEKRAEQPKGTILLLHGRTWSAVPDFDLQVAGEKLSFMEGLLAKGYTVYALDARGYGGTPRDESGWLTPDRAAKDATAVLEWIKSNNNLDSHLFGWSYGSMVSQLVVQRAPNLVSSVTLFGYPYNPSRFVFSERPEYPKKAPAKSNTAHNAASDFITPGSISDEAIEAYVEAALKADPVRVDFKDLHQWQELDPTLITTPILLLQAEFDPLAPTEQQANFFKNVGTSEKWWISLPDGDHAALLETPRARMLAAIDNFILSLKY